ncbi:MAG: riboflavin synthase [Eubacterium sp.]|nr:riboflavin synthase [Eubacterium sp.]
MFTGIIEEVGTIDKIEKGSQSAILRVSCRKVIDGTRIGDSIAVNGVCLTATSIGNDGFSADVMDETVRRSSLSDLRSGSRVNLERAMPADGRFGGHIVAGHVDGTGVIRDITKEEMAVVYRIGIVKSRQGDGHDSGDADLLRYVVQKGSIAIDGISLTVAEVDDTGFSVSIIPHTISQTTLHEKRTGDIVNIETDIIGKYVEKLIGNNSISAIPSAFFGRLSGSTEKAEEFLAENGFY